MEVMNEAGSANQKPNNNKELSTSKTREEGELSSSDDENLGSAFAHTSGAHSAATLFTTPANKYTQGTQMVKTGSGNNLSSSVDSQPRTSIQINSLKTFEQNRVTFKSNNPGRFLSSGANDNLVISFSDDDSGSDTEEHRCKKAFENKSSTSKADENGRPPTSSAVKLKNLRQTVRNVSKVMPKRLSPSQTVIGSTSRIHGGANSWVSRPSLVEQRSRIRKFNVNKNLGSQERGCDQGVDLRNSQLQDLRQQIALRESELKLKAAQQNKDLVLESCDNYHAMTISSDAAKKFHSTSTDVGQLEQKEPDKKRLKVAGSYSHQLIADGRKAVPVTKSIVLVKEPTLEKSNLHDRNEVDHSREGVPISRIESDIVTSGKQNGSRVDVVPKNVPNVVKNAANVNTNHNQSKKDSKRVDPRLLLKETTQLANRMASNLPKNFGQIESNHASKIGGHYPSPFLNKAMGKQNVKESSDYSKAISVDKTIEPLFGNIHQVNNSSLWNCSGNVNVAGHSNVDMESLLGMEELLDKELEEAQQHRRMCEIEERNTLKAYRKAQRALIEANARCSKFYCQRELCSAEFRSFIMDDPNLLLSPRQHEAVRNQLDLSKHLSENMQLVPTSSHYRQSGYVGLNQRGYDSSIQCVNGAPMDSFHDHANGQNMGSEPCSEPDASTSEPLPDKSKNVVNGLSPHSNEMNVSADEDEEIFQLNNEPVRLNYEYQRKDQISDGRKMSTNNKPNKKLSANSSQDPLLLEATLRSELFARMGMRTLSKNSGSCFNVSVERGADNDIGSDRMQMSNESVPSSGGQNQQHDIGGTPERSIHDAPVQIQDQCHVEDSNVEFHSISDPKDKFPTRADHSMICALLSPPSILSVFVHLKSGMNITLSYQKGNQQNHKLNFDIKEGDCVNCNETQDRNLMANLRPETIKGFFEREIGAYTCNLAVDPFWPLCMYELRGKCNNDECPWQHLKDFSDGNMYQHDNSESADCQIRSTIHQANCNDATKLSKGRDILIPPTYIVALDILKTNPRSYESVVAKRHGQCWQKCFSVSLALSSMFQKDLPADFLHAGDVRIEWHGSWNRQSSYFQSRNGVMNQLKQAVVSNEQSVEMALLVLNQEANKLEGVKKALSLLSRALEADPTSEILWIIYVLLFYSSTKSVGKDDMFTHAVKHNEGSYGLWLMYINSRIQLDDRLAAYDAALSALCCRASACNEDETHASACILDLFLQMIECYCMSGNIEKAIYRISGLFLPSTDSYDPHSSFLSDILKCLTVSDKLIFWVCCLYLAIYRKLPDAVLQRFECEKELLAIEWPAVHLEHDEKQRAVKLVERAVDSVETYISSELVKREIELRSVQYFGVSHIRCMAVLEGLECCRNLLEKYIKLYPSCLELVLISARLQKHDFGDLSFVGFEKALIKWPKGVPGIQCIWNQYAEDALRNGKTNFAAELMGRWFHSVWKVEHSKDFLDPIVADMSHSSPESSSTSNPDFLVSNKNQMDVMFGYLNLSLHKLLQNDYNEARLAIDGALRAAAPEHFKHCVREHATLLLIDELEPKEGTLQSWQLKLLNGYLDRDQPFCYSEPLSRQFINNIERSRVRQLITNLLSPISSDFSLVNLVLELCYGPSLLPQKFSKLKDLVDFVEAIMEIVPSNYQLAFSVFKLLNREYNPNDTDAIPASVLFWASLTLVTAILHAVPVPPEYVWVDAAAVLGNVTGTEAISEKFYKKALSVYPFSFKLWKCYYDLFKTRGDSTSIVKAARQKGIEFD